MDNRRDFLKMAGMAMPIGAAGMFFATGKASAAEEVEKVADIIGKLPNNILYTSANEGKWKGKGKSHIPMLAVKEDKGSIVTKHTMSPKHFIVRHTLVDAKGEVVFGHTFMHDDKEAKSKFDGTKVKKGEVYYAMSFCNQHDLWLAEVKI